MTKTHQHKFSDLAPEKKTLELHVSDCTQPPQNINIYDASRGDFFALMILIDGRINIKINLKEHAITKNSMLFLAPNTLKQLVNATEDTRLYKVIFTSGFLLQIGIQKHEIEMIDFISRSRDSVIQLSDQEMSKILKLMEDLKEKNEHATEHPFGEEIVQYTFRIFLSEMAAIGINHNIGPRKARVSRKEDLVMRFGNLINQHFKEHRAVKYYAERLAITPNYLNEIIHEVTGKSASELIDEKVMHEAKLLLNNPRLTIAQIAELLHFSDQSFLGKFFKRHLGISPSEYRGHHLTTCI